MHSEETRNLARKLRNDGKTYEDIGKILSIPLFAARNLCVYNPRLVKCTVGRKRKISKTETLRIKRGISSCLEVGERITSAKLISKCDLHVSRWTVQRHLRRAQFKYSKAKKIINLTSSHKRIRIEIISEWFSNNHCWEKTVFTDEKRFSLDGPDNWSSYHSKHTKLIRQCRQCKGGGIMVWGMVTPGGTLYYQFITGKFNSNGYVELLANYAVPHIINDLGSDYYLQQDNSPVHISKDTKEYFKKNNIRLLRWPAKSPDINIMEDVWKRLSDYVYDGKQFSTLTELKDKIIDGFDHLNSVDEEKLKALFSSFRHRLTVVMNKRGDLFNK